MNKIHSKYINYIVEHKDNVTKAINYICDNILIDHPELLEDTKIESIKNIGMIHDQSKYSTQEFDAYADYFYGDSSKDPKVLEAFNYAWLHHIHENPHHWQFWVLINDEDGTEALEMPFPYLVEMIADWWSFSIKQKKYDEIFKWYDNHKKNMILNDKTKATVETILRLLKDKNLKNGEDLE